MESQAILQILIEEFYSKLESLKDLVPREAEFVKAANKIKVAIGMRRTGKTYLVYEHILHLLSQGVAKTQILYINVEDDRLEFLDKKQFAKLVDAFYSLYPENHEKKCYLFFDGIQNVDDWAQVIRRFHDSKNAEIFLTGSSAKLLSKEIATNLRGALFQRKFGPIVLKNLWWLKKSRLIEVCMEIKLEIIWLKLSIII